MSSTHGRRVPLARSRVGLYQTKCPAWGKSRSKALASAATRPLIAARYYPRPSICKAGRRGRCQGTSPGVPGPELTHRYVKPPNSQVQAVWPRTPTPVESKQVHEGSTCGRHEARRCDNAGLILKCILKPGHCPRPVDFSQGTRCIRSAVATPVLERFHVPLETIHTSTM